MSGEGVVQQSAGLLYTPTGCLTINVPPNDIMVQNFPLYLTTSEQPTDSVLTVYNRGLGFGEQERQWDGGGEIVAILE